MTWLFQNKEFTSDMIGKHVGMVYLITNNLSGKKYVGKKKFTFKKTKQVNKKKKRVNVESDWQEYYGSNDLLKQDVEELGRENFTREILHLCNGLGECSYLEAKEQFIRDALLSDGYYNSWISVKVTRNHVKGLWLKPQ